MRVHYPRTPHLPWSPGASADDVRVADLSGLVGREVVVTEKLDGENTTLYRDGLHARSLDSGHHPSRAWVKALQGLVGASIPPGRRVCGENMYARHSLSYEDLSSWFYAFSVWDGERCLGWDDTVDVTRRLGVPEPPVLWRGAFDERALRALRLDLTRQEGYVVRTTSGFTRADFARHVAKWVRRGHVQTDTHWMHAPVVVNGRGADAALWDVRAGFPVDAPAVLAAVGMSADDATGDAVGSTRGGAGDGAIGSACGTSGTAGSDAGGAVGDIRGGAGDGSLGGASSTSDSGGSTANSAGSEDAGGGAASGTTGGGIGSASDGGGGTASGTTGGGIGSASDGGGGPIGTAGAINRAGGGAIGDVVARIGRTGDARLVGVLAALLLDRPRSWLMPRLVRPLGMPDARQVADLVGLAPLLRKDFPDNERRAGLTRMAVAVDLGVLHAIAGDSANVEWSALVAEEAGLLGEDPLRPLREALPYEDVDVRDRCWAEARRALSDGRLHTPAEAEAVTWRWRSGDFPHLIVMVGPAGSGKSTFVSTLDVDEVVSLDDLRAEQGATAAVLHDGLDRLDKALARGGTVVWDATALNRHQRSTVAKVAAGRDALVTHAVLVVAEEVAARRNAARRHPVPADVLAAQFRRFSPPYPGEAHRTWYIGAGGTIDDVVVG
ncbi:RNA ligase family protein [Actinophytocola sp. NPDC049390]|uniref:RNA ligase family protein n=1 Tax=Actinophytocola sp. NPDC049390 TaxID=3363894 RepID=UPI0037876DE5